MAILILVLVLVVALGCLGAMLFVLRRRLAVRSGAPSRKATTSTALPFRWSYVSAPLVALVLSVVLVAVFYGRLPAEVAYRFTGDGSPDGWISRTMIVLFALGPQVFLALAAMATTWIAAWLGSRFQRGQSVGLDPGRVISLMGNMVALPQFVLFFAMLDIFSYNSYELHILPLWAIALIVLLVGGIVLGIFFMRAMRDVWKSTH
jgi:uncharacterized membrane protein